MAFTSASRCSRSLVLLAAIASTIPGVAEAQDFCTALKQAVQEAARNFAGVKTSTLHPDYPGSGVFIARSVFPGGKDKDCFFEAPAKYSCDLGEQYVGNNRDNHRQNIAAYLAEVEVAEKCFALAPIRQRGDANRTDGPGASKLWRVPPDVSVQISIGFSDAGGVLKSSRGILVSK